MNFKSHAIGTDKLDQVNDWKIYVSIFLLSACPIKLYCDAFVLFINVLCNRTNRLVSFISFSPGKTFNREKNQKIIRIFLSTLVFLRIEKLQVRYVFGFGTSYMHKLYKENSKVIVNNIRVFYEENIILLFIRCSMKRCRSSRDKRNTIKFFWNASAAKVYAHQMTI